MPVHDGQHGEQDHVEHGEAKDLIGGYGQDRAEQNGLHLLRRGRRESGEEQSEAGGEGEHGAGGDLPLRGALAQRSDDQRAAQRKHSHAERDRQPQQHRAGGAGQSDMGQRVRGERRMACDGEISHHARGERDAQAREEGVGHERGGQGVHPVGIEGEN